MKGLSVLRAQQVMADLNIALCRDLNIDIIQNEPQYILLPKSSHKILHFKKLLKTVYRNHQPQLTLNTYYVKQTTRYRHKLEETRLYCDNIIMSNLDSLVFFCSVLGTNTVVSGLPSFWWYNMKSRLTYADLNVVFRVPNDPLSHILCTRKHMIEVFVGSLQDIKLQERF